VRGFGRFIGIDYSGAETPKARLKGLQVYEALSGQLPQRMTSPAAKPSAARHWTRKAIAQWLIERVEAGEPFIAGIDHGFALPDSYLQRHGLTHWPQFLDDFCRHWPADGDEVTVESLRPRNPRSGTTQEFRLCERWTSSAKSVFQFDVQGSVAKSTHAGIPWLRRIREAVGELVHFWPFDGWQPPAGKSVIAEVYPSVFRNRYPKESRTPDEQDAYVVARWLAEMAGRGELGRYWSPPLTDEERVVAGREGWILGVC
jgi:hypothetical protein